MLTGLTKSLRTTTFFPNILEGMIVHPYSKEMVQMFLRDSAKVEEILALLNQGMT
jgi:hypothetical protein